MIQNEIGDTFFHGQTKQEIIDRIINFELEQDMLPDWRDVLEYGFGGYQYLDDETLKTMYEEYFVDEEHEDDPDYVPNDYVVLDGHGDNIPNDYTGDTQ